MPDEVGDLLKRFIFSTLWCSFAFAAELVVASLRSYAAGQRRKYNQNLRRYNQDLHMTSETNIEHCWRNTRTRIQTFVEIWW